MQYGLIVEDTGLTAEWLKNILQQAFVGIQTHTIPTCQETKQYIQTQPINLALIDINLPDGNGLELIRFILYHQPHAYIVITTIFDDSEHILQALQAGAHGYLLKDLPDHLFIQKLRGIMSGDPPISPSISRQILRYFTSQQTIPHSQNPPSTAVVPDCLSAREKEVLILVAKGLNRNEVAEHLGLSGHTVAGYIRDIYQKLKISSRAEAALEACRMGLIRTGA